MRKAHDDRLLTEQPRRLPWAARQGLPDWSDICVCNLVDGTAQHHWETTSHWHLKQILHFPKRKQKYTFLTKNQGSGWHWVSYAKYWKKKTKYGCVQWRSRYHGAYPEPRLLETWWELKRSLGNIACQSKKEKKIWFPSQKPICGRKKTNKTTKYGGTRRSFQISVLGVWIGLCPEQHGRKFFSLCNSHPLSLHKHEL